MGACNQVCLSSNQEESTDSMLILPKSSLTSIKWNQKESISTQEDFQDSIDSPEDNQHLCTAVRFYRRGCYQEAINQYMLALHSISKDQPTFAQVHARISRSYLKMGRHHLATQHCKVALDRAQEKGWEEAAWCAQLMAEIKMAQHDCILAIYFYEKALKGFQELAQEYKVMEMMYCMGLIYMELRNHDKVILLYEGLLAMKIKEGHSNTGPLFKIHLYLARIYAIREQYELSIRSFASCFQILVEKSQEYRETVFEFRQMAESMRKSCPFQDLLPLLGLIARTPCLQKLI